MIASAVNSRPKFFTLFRGVCIFLGCIGIIGTAMLFLMSFIPQMKAAFEAQGDTSISDAIWLIQSLALIISGVWIFKLKEIGRIAILICALYSLITTIYYYLPVASTIPFWSLPSLLVISLSLVNVLIFGYFIRRDLKTYIQAKSTT